MAAERDPRSINERGYEMASHHCEDCGRSTYWDAAGRKDYTIRKCIDCGIEKPWPEDFR